MITKKNRKELTDYNDKLYEKSIDLERVMDFLMANICPKSNKNSNSKFKRQHSGTFMENLKYT